MEALFVLIPLSLGLVLLIGAVLVWAAMSGQFESIEDEGNRIFEENVSNGVLTDDTVSVQAASKQKNP